MCEEAPLLTNEKIIIKSLIIFLFSPRELNNLIYLDSTSLCSSEIHHFVAEPKHKWLSSEHKRLFNTWVAKYEEEYSTTTSLLGTSY